EGKATVQPGQRPLKRHDSHMAQQMVERAAELARDSHARTRHAVVLVKDDSLLGGPTGCRFRGKTTATASSGSLAIMTGAARTRSSGRSRWPAPAMAGGCYRDR